MPMEYYYISVDSETKRGTLELRFHSKVESQLIKEFKLVESREIAYHTTEGDLVYIDHGPKVISLTMVGEEKKELEGD